MIPAAFVAQIQQRFNYEKRAKVCLWFDPQEEFRRVLPALDVYLAQQSPIPFHLLSYDRKAKHGQLWLKRHVWELGQDRNTRFLLYFPLSEERLNTPDETGRHHLELLADFRITGVDWKVGGKRPTLFSFLKAAGVALPTDPTEQRKLTEGLADSLLAKYAAKFASKPQSFWEETVTPELTQARLVGDVDQTLLDLAVDPEAKWAELLVKGVLAEFLSAVAERLGDVPRTDNPVLWVKAIVERLALAEAFIGYGESPDFPFADRLPPARHREAHVALLRRWLRDANCRGAWDRWVADVEQHVNLTAWVKGKSGAAHGFPHLISLRWQQALEGFIAASGTSEAFSAYVRDQPPILQREVDYARTGGPEGCAWDLLLGVTRFLEAATRLRRSASEAASSGECLRLYLDFAATVDGEHLRLKAEANERGLADIGRTLDRAYGEATNAINHRFFDHYVADTSTEIPGLPFVTSHLEAHVWKSNARRAVIIVDAIRYDVALRLRDLLGGFQVSVEPMRAMLPTRTPIGMSALLPAKFAPTSLKTTGNELHPIRENLDLSVRENRLKLLKEHGADCRDIATVESGSSKPGKLPPLLVVYGHEEVDSIGHGDGEALIRHVQKELERIARVIRKLHQWGYPEVNVVTDHGFVLLDESHLPPEVPVNKDWCLVLKERFAIVPASADLPIKTKHFAWDESVRVAIPPGLAFFKAEKSFSHGGAALQEIVIPRLLSRSQTKQQKVGVEVLLAGAGANLSSAAVKLIFRPVLVGEAGEMAALVALPRTLEINVTQRQGAESVSVLPRRDPKKIQLGTSGEVPLTLFFDSKFQFKQGDELRLEIRDPDSGEQFPGPGGVVLHFARDL